MMGYEKKRLPHIVFGSGAASDIGRYAGELGLKKCLIVTDCGVVELGIASKIIKSMQLEDIMCDIYDGVLPDPADTLCMEVGRIIRDERYDGVIGLGGGSSMDVAKVGCLIAGIPDEIEELHDFSMSGSKMRQSFKRAATFITIPTTSGTGAECTATGVISSSRLNLKYSIGNENAVADLAIVDPALTLGMPANVTVCCALDALAHAVENAIGMQKNEYTNSVMLECVEKVWKWLPVAVEDPLDLEAREQLSWASHNSLSNGGLLNGHAISHAIGSLYHLVHGHACAIVLPTVIRHFAQVKSSDAVIREIARRIGIPTTDSPDIDVNRVADALRDYYKRFGLSPLQQAMRANGFDDNREEFIRRAIPLTLDDYKSKLWLPSIHNEDDRERLEKVLAMIYDEQ